MNLTPIIRITAILTLLLLTADLAVHGAGQAGGARSGVVAGPGSGVDRNGGAPNQRGGRSAGDAQSDAKAASVRDLLATEAFSDQASGISFFPPLDTVLSTGGAIGALARMQNNKLGYQISVTVKKSERTIKLGDVLRSAMQQMLSLDDTARGVVTAPGAVATGQAANKKVEGETVLMDQRQFKVSGREAAALYFKIVRRDGPMAVGQSFVMMDDRSVVVLQVDTKLEDWERVKPVFDALVESLTVEDPVEQAKRREEMVKNSASWRRGLATGALKGLIGPAQWFRIIDSAGHDTGYMRITVEPAQDLQKQGVRVRLDSRIMVGAAQADTLSQFFLSDDGVIENWSIRTTNRAAQGARAQRGAPELVTWTETGVRDRASIKLIRNGPEGKQSLDWSVANAMDSYLSQAELHLLGELLPHDKESSFGFYAYNSSAGKLMFRTDRIVPRGDGKYEVHSKPSLDQPEQLTVFDASGRMLERRMPGGQMIKPASAAEMKALWQLQ